MKKFILKFKWQLLFVGFVIATVLIYIATLDNEIEEREANVKEVEDWFLEERKKVIKEAVEKTATENKRVQKEIESNDKEIEDIRKDMEVKNEEIDKMDLEELSDLFIDLGY
ncbi:MAG: hypothetical protein CL489_10925 [Acidobacteria bacterium]|nr:hypothetical protein [Acidobacteriota bacterium]